MPRHSLALMICLAASATLASQLLSQQAMAQSSRERPNMFPDSSVAVPQANVDKQFPLGASWSAISLNGKAVGGDRPTLVVDDQLRGKGFAGCNTYSATAYPLREQGFAVGPVAVTKKACDGGSMASERAFLTALRGARKWDIQGGRLIIQGVAGELRFERVL